MVFASIFLSVIGVAQAMQAGAVRREKRKTVTLKQGLAWGRAATGEMGQLQQAGPRAGQGQPLNGRGDRDGGVGRSEPADFSSLQLFMNLIFQKLRNAGS